MPLTSHKLGLNAHAMLNAIWLKNSVWENSAMLKMCSINSSYTWPKFLKLSSPVLDLKRYIFHQETFLKLFLDFSLYNHQNSTQNTCTRNWKISWPDFKQAYLINHATKIHELYIKRQIFKISKTFIWTIISHSSIFYINRKHV